MKMSVFTIRTIEPRDDAAMAQVIRRVMPEFGAVELQRQKLEKRLPSGGQERVRSGCDGHVGASVEIVRLSV